MDSLDEERIRVEGQLAQQIIANPLFQRHNEALLKEALSDWADSDDPAERERIWHEHQAIRKYIDGLRDYLYTAMQLSEE